MSANELDEIMLRLKAEGSGGFPIPWGHFGDSAAEAGLLANECGWMDVRGWGVIKFEGEAVLQMLQGQLTLDVAGWSEGNGGYAAYLDRKGRMISDLILAQPSPGQVRVLVHPNRIPVILKKLAPVAMLADCTLRDASSEDGRVLIAGPKAVTELLALGAPQALSELADYDSLQFNMQTFELRAQALPDYGVPAFLIECELSDSLEFIRWLAGNSGLPPVGFEAQEVLRIESGTPRWGQELSEDNLAPECNMAHAISYTKGCYVGQETVARLRTYGQTNKRLCGFHSKEVLPAGSELFDGDKKVGWVTSTAFSHHLARPIAMGYAKRRHNEAGQILKDQDGNKVEIYSLPKHQE
ncbi:MAG: glycine cleavage T C-terminal barrel domain-containing protein [Planctomycetota bacterium]